MKTSHCAIVLLLSAASILPCLNASARSKEPDYPCYMRTVNGRVVDLTASLCRYKAVAVPIAAATDTQSITEPESPFITSYKQRARRVENVAAAKYLLAQADTNSEKLLSIGSSVCRGVNVKLSRPELVTIIEKALPTDNENAVLHYAGLQQISILLDMAEAGECP
ncbi:MAG: hypothetical protein ACAF41_12010 [Leptolyngbya sp. BL-A-14]